jgi:hypothetical protein
MTHHHHHPHQHPRAAAGASFLRASVGERLAVAAVVSAVLWLAIMWVMS